MRIPLRAALFISRSCMKLAVGAMFLFVSVHVFGAEVTWTRFHGSVKTLNRITKELTLQMKDGDLIGLKITDDVEIIKGKDKVLLTNIDIDDRITLLNVPHIKDSGSVNESDMAHPKL